MASALPCHFSGNRIGPCIEKRREQRESGSLPLATRVNIRNSNTFLLLGAGFLVLLSAHSYVAIACALVSISFLSIPRHFHYNPVIKPFNPCSIWNRVQENLQYSQHHGTKEWVYLNLGCQTYSQQAACGLQRPTCIWPSDLLEGLGIWQQEQVPLFVVKRPWGLINPSFIPLPNSWMQSFTGDLFWWWQGEQQWH